MNTAQIMKMFEETAYVRTGGSPEELRCALYLQQQCKELGYDAKLESFSVDMANMKTALGRAAEPDEIVDMILYLASDKGAFITGTTFLLDGGRNIMFQK